MEFLICNSEIIREEELNLNQLFREDFHVIQKYIWYGHGGIPLFFEDIDHLCNEIETFGFKVPDFLFDKTELRRISKRLLNKNKLYRTGVLFLRLFFSAEKVYYTINCRNFEHSVFPFSDKGLLVGVSEIKKLSQNTLNSFAFYNQTNWVQESAVIRKSGHQNSLFLNEFQNVCEGIGANIFMIKDHVLLTPSLESGCYLDSIRSVILEVAQKTNLQVIESSDISVDHLTQMDEIFLASEARGIEWVMGIANKRFVPNITKAIHLQVDDFLKIKTQSMF